jgi:hypothetical protein
MAANCNQSPIGGGDAITIKLPINALIHQQDPCMNLKTIFESTQLPYMKKPTNEPLSQDDLPSAVMGSQIKPTYESEAVYWD